MRIHHSELYHMRGSGIGGIFSSVFRTLVPIAKTILGIGTRAAASPLGKQVLGAAKRSAVKAGLDAPGGRREHPVRSFGSWGSGCR